MVFRIVAAESAMPNLFEMVRLPAGSAVWTYVSMTASSTCRSRSVSEVATAPNLLLPNNLGSYGTIGQVADDAVQAKPAFRRAHQPLLGHVHPAPRHTPGGRGRQRAAEGGKGDPRIRSQPKVKALQVPLLVGQGLFRFRRAAVLRHGATIRFPRGKIPAPRPAVIAVGSGAEAEVSPARPIGRIVARAEAFARGVGDFVEPVAAGCEMCVREQILFRVPLVARSPDGTARDPARERRALLHGEPVQG